MEILRNILAKTLDVAAVVAGLDNRDGAKYLPAGARGAIKNLLSSLSNFTEIALFALLCSRLSAFFVGKSLFKTPERFVNGFRGETPSFDEGEHGAANLR